MSASYASSARPPTAAIAWATRDELLVELPTKAGPPYIVRYRKTVEGLSAALNILIEHQDAAPKPIAQADHPAVTKISNRAPWAGDAERERVREIMKRLKIT